VFWLDTTVRIVLESSQWCWRNSDCWLLLYVTGNHYNRLCSVRFSLQPAFQFCSSEQLLLLISVKYTEQYTCALCERSKWKCCMFFLTISRDYAFRIAAHSAFLSSVVIIRTGCCNIKKSWNYIHTAYLCVLYGSQNKQRLFPYTGFYNRDGVFTARYELTTFLRLRVSVMVFKYLCNLVSVLLLSFYCNCLIVHTTSNINYQ
jgi:hypothetical protein